MGDIGWAVAVAVLVMMEPSSSRLQSVLVRCWMVLREGLPTLDERREGKPDVG